MSCLVMGKPRVRQQMIHLLPHHQKSKSVWSPKVSGTKNAGTEPYKAMLGVGFPLHKQYPYSLYRWGDVLFAEILMV